MLLPLQPMYHVQVLNQVFFNYQNEIHSNHPDLDTQSLLSKLASIHDDIARKKTLEAPELREHAAQIRSVLLPIIEQCTLEDFFSIPWKNEFISAAYDTLQALTVLFPLNTQSVMTFETLTFNDPDHLPLSTGALLNMQELIEFNARRDFRDADRVRVLAVYNPWTNAVLNTVDTINFRNRLEGMPSNAFSRREANLPQNLRRQARESRILQLSKGYRIHYSGNLQNLLLIVHCAVRR